MTEKNDIVDVHAHICSYFVFVFVEVPKGTRGQCGMNDVDCYGIPYHKRVGHNMQLVGSEIKLPVVRTMIMLPNQVKMQSHSFLAHAAYIHVFHNCLVYVFSEEAQTLVKYEVNLNRIMVTFIPDPSVKISTWFRVTSKSAF